MKASPLLNSWNSGQLSAYLEGRQDLKKYSNGAYLLSNMIPTIQGPLRKRPGTVFVAETKDSSKASRLITFQFSSTDAYALEFGDLYMRVYKDGGQVQDGGSPYEIATPYTADQVGLLQIAQQADVMFITSPDHPPYQLSRLGDADWTLAEYEFTSPPFNSENLDTDLSITASASTGSITLTSSSALFDAAHIGSYWKLSETVASKHDSWVNDEAVVIDDLRKYSGNVYKATSAGTTGLRPPVHLDGTESDGAVNWLYLHSGSGIAKVTGFVSDTVLEADVIDYIPDSAQSGTDLWNEGAFSGVQGYPKAVTFFEGRLWLAGTNGKPQSLWASKVDIYNDFESGANDADGLFFTIASDQVNVIQWMSPSRVLSIGTSNYEFTATGSSLDQAITPNSVRILPQTESGSEAVQAIKVSNTSIFIQSGGRKLREYRYDYDSDSYISEDLTLLSEDVFNTETKAGRFIDMAYMQEPNQIIWCALDTGKLAGLTYEKTQQVVGWHNHDVGGSVESLTVSPDSQLKEGRLWLIINRTINGQTKRYVEYLETDRDSRFDDPDVYTIYSDSALVYDSTPATVISGLDHLEGETVAILADGANHPPKTVLSGQVTLNYASSVVVIGLPYTADLVTMRIEAGAADGTAQGKTKRINNVTIRLFRVGAGLYYGDSLSSAELIPFRTSFDLMDNPVPFYTGDTEKLSYNGGYETEGRIAISHRAPTPCTIISIMPQLTTQDR